MKGFDEECRKRKKELTEIIEKVKKGELSKESCVYKIKENKDLIRRKKNRYNENCLREVEKDKSMNKFWRGIGKSKQRVEISEKIGKNE